MVVVTEGRQSERVLLLQVMFCPYCHRSFSGVGRKQRYDRHIMTHTGEKPYACPLCPLRCNRESNLYRHLRRHHGCTNHDTDSIISPSTSS
ncbi:hypothetical protein Pcinc_014480 [Petrolisthes cinctipes]|uniref:C2H2-type domain-containing protein n=1 Tax=Petrolisthes cinctipes TaxID=88211 RepID=A0AAE1FUR7_PETCI|nr:hypothetical protein Pcinc_014480 [Petrolisthes cinctipes]